MQRSIVFMPSPWGSGGGDLRVFPHYLWDSYGENAKQKPIKSRDAVVQKYQRSFAQQWASQSGVPPQGAGSPRKPTDVSLDAPANPRNHRNLVEQIREEIRR
jgi:hypothetical protein